MRKTLLLILIYLISFYNQGFSQELEIIKANLFKKGHYTFDEYFNEINSAGVFGIWDFPIGVANSSSSHEASKYNYEAANLSDYNFSTAWIEGAKGFGIGEFIEFKFSKDFVYASPYNFHGECIIYNGYCKTYKTWTENSRVKRFKVYYNGESICVIELLDTWHEQLLDLSKFFVNKRENKFLNAKHEIIEGDIIRFEIIDFYKGTKYEDVAISEFLCTGSGN